MTVVIGSQTDVPTTGDPIVSPWYQDTSRKLVHAFASAAARDAWASPPDGAMCVTTNTDQLWQRKNGVWAEIASVADGNTRWAQLAASNTYATDVTNIFRGSTLVGPAAGAGNPGIDKAGWYFNVDGHGEGRVETNVPNLYLKHSGTADVNGMDFISFYRFSSTVIGRIHQASPTTVAYATTSDPRSKTPPPATRGIGDAAARVRQLGALAWQGRHIVPETGQEDGGDTWDFLSSHDIEDVAPYAVHGERDAVDADGQPVFQTVSFPDLVPLLFAALAEAFDEIDALKAAR